MQEQSLSPLHSAARKYAEAGIPVFPCVPGSKTPATEHGFHDASANLEQVDAWWSTNPDYNIAFSPHTVGLGVVDIDGQAGEDAWFALELEHGTPPETWTVATPRGGRHLYYRGELRPSQSILAPHVDTRGRGSYALLPPSRFGTGEYVVTVSAPYADVPEWIPAALEAAQKARIGAADVPLDLPANISRAVSLLRSYVARGHIAVEGEMGDGRTYAVAAELTNLGLSEAVVLELLLAEWNPHNQPPWPEDELAVKVRNAAAYAQNEAGAWATAPAAEVFGATLDKLHLTSEPERRSRFYPYDESEQDVMPEPTWLLPGVLPADSTVMFYGQPSSYKSFLALDLALTLASGVAGFGAPAREPQQVVYVAGEGPRSISRYRRPAWRLARDVSGPIPFNIVTDMPLIASRNMFEEFISEIRGRALHPKLIVLDTLARAMAGLNENDAKDAGLFIEAVEALKREFGCTVLVVHHEGKEQGRGARGSSALVGGFDAVYEIKADKGTKAVALWNRKQKDAAEVEKPWMFEGREIGGTLVFFPIDGKAYHTLTAGSDTLSPRHVGAALARLKAYGPAHGVTSHVLASELHPHDETESAEQRGESIERVVRAIRVRARGALEPYAERGGRELTWYLPSQEPAGA